MIIRKTMETDLEDALVVERAAFGSDEEAALVRDLMGDNSAGPTVSLLAFIDGRAVGHILFTRAHLEPVAPLSLYILAPLAVIPEFQNQGIGGALIEKGIQILSEADVDLVFVLGHPAYYPRFGFKPAGVLGFAATYPIPEKNADAWMVQALKSEILEQYSGTVVCADTMHKPKYWRE
jgi:putative acetyltransferase